MTEVRILIFSYFSDKIFLFYIILLILQKYIKKNNYIYSFIKIKVNVCIKKC